MSLYITDEQYKSAEEEQGGWCLNCERYEAGIGGDEDGKRCDGCGHYELCGYQHLTDMGLLLIRETVNYDDVGDFDLEGLDLDA